MSDYDRLRRELDDAERHIKRVKNTSPGSANIATMLVIGKMRLIFAEMLQALEACGYRARAFVVNAKHYGVPQSRPRLVVLGVRQDLDVDRLTPLAPLGARPRLVQHALEAVPASDLFRRLGPVNRRIWKGATVGGRGCDIGRGASHFSHVKVSPYRPAPTLTKVGGHNYMHWREPRSLSIAEAKRLSSFPDAFQMHGTFDQQWGRLGNSVPPFLMWAVAAHMRQVLEV